MFAALDWCVPAGAALVQGGPGSGKTTLLRLLAGELPPDRGRISLRGEPLASLRGQVFWPPAETVGAEQMPVVDWWRAQAARYPRWDAAALERHVEGFGLEPHQNKAFFMLSTGTRRKAALAAALASGARFFDRRSGRLERVRCGSSGRARGHHTRHHVARVG